jgi:hypothetical protein
VHQEPFNPTKSRGLGPRRTVEVPWDKTRSRTRIVLNRLRAVDRLKHGVGDKAPGMDIGWDEAARGNEVRVGGFRVGQLRLVGIAELIGPRAFRLLGQSAQVLGRVTPPATLRRFWVASADIVNGKCENGLADWPYYTEAPLRPTRSFPPAISKT